MHSDGSIVPLRPDSIQPGQTWRHRAFSLAEVLATVSLLGILALIALPRFSGTAATAQKYVCYTLKGNTETQVQLWYRQKGPWPQADLSDISTDPAYFPDGLVSCPVDGTAYVLDNSTRRVIGHDH